MLPTTTITAIIEVSMTEMNVKRHGGRRGATMATVAGR